MVLVTDYSIKNRQDGSSFVALEVSGGLELVQSQSTGKFYATLRKCNIPSTFDASIARMLVGSQLPGEIVRITVDPYEYTNKQTGEVMMLSHSYAYKPAEKQELVGITRISELQTS